MKKFAEYKAKMTSAKTKRQEFIDYINNINDIGFLKRILEIYGDMQLIGDLKYREYWAITIIENRIKEKELNGN